MEKVTVNDIASMMMQPEPEPVTESTGGTDEASESQPVEAASVEGAEAETNDSYEDADESDDSDESDRYIVKVDGEEVEITIEEALAGYQRDSDYRKKTMTLAEERKAAEAKAAEIDSTLQELKSFIKREEDTTDWEALRRDNPGEYLERKEALEKAKASHEKATAKRNEEMQAQYQAKVSQEVKLLTEAMGPTWDDSARSADIKLASDYLTKMGFSEQEIGSIADHRAWLVFLDAAKASKFNETKSKISKEVRKAPKSVKSGQRVPKSERDRKDSLEMMSSAPTRKGRIGALANLLGS